MTIESLFWKYEKTVVFSNYVVLLDILVILAELRSATL